MREAGDVRRKARAPENARQGRACCPPCASRQGMTHWSYAVGRCRERQRWSTTTLRADWLRPFVTGAARRPLPLAMTRYTCSASGARRNPKGSYLVVHSGAGSKREELSCQQYRLEAHFVTDDPHLSNLRQILGPRAPELLFPCIEDLVVHGLDVARFEPRDARPNRQDVAMFVAAWLRHAGLTTDIFCTSWFTGYCVAKLSAISSSSPSQIRHSAKSTMKFILSSEVPFSCRRAGNPFKAHCSTGCPFHAVASDIATAPRVPRASTPPAPVVPSVLPKKRPTPRSSPKR